MKLGGNKSKGQEMIRMERNAKGRIGKIKDGKKEYVTCCRIAYAHDTMREGKCSMGQKEKKKKQNKT